MRIGTIEATKINDLWMVEYDSGELESATNSIEITGLDGDTDEEYIFLMRLRNDDTTADVLYEGRFNSDSGNNYGDQRMRAYGSTLAAASNTGLDAMVFGYSGDADNNDRMTFGIYHLFIKTGNKRLVISQFGRELGANVATEVQGRAFVWNNTLDNLTSIQLIADQTNGFGVGTRIILLKKVNATSGMKTGELEIQGDVENAWQKVYENDLSSDATSVDITGLDGNTDVIYRCIWKIKNGYAGNTLFYSTLNNDSSANYGQVHMFAEGTNEGAGNSSGDNYVNNLGYMSGSGDLTSGEFFIYAKAGYERLLIIPVQAREVTSTTVQRIISMAAIWNNTLDNLTSIQLIADQTNGLAQDSHIELWKLNL